MKLREIDICRRTIYQNLKRANINEQEEIAYNEFDGYEIITIHAFGSNREFWFLEPINESIKTYRWFDDNKVETLQTYTSLDEAKLGHKKWCEKEYKK